MKKEESLKIIESRISDLNVLIKLNSRNANSSLQTNVEAWQFAQNELILVRDAIANIEECEV